LAHESVLALSFAAGFYFAERADAGIRERCPFNPKRPGGRLRFALFFELHVGAPGSPAARRPRRLAAQRTGPKEFDASLTAPLVSQMPLPEWVSLSSFCIQGFGRGWSGGAMLQPWWSPLATRSSGVAGCLLFQGAPKPRHFPAQQHAGRLWFAFKGLRSVSRLASSHFCSDMQEIPPVFEASRRRRSP